MKIKHTLILLLFFTSYSYSNNRLSSIVDSLRNQGIDTIGIFTTFCPGGAMSDEPNDTCFDAGIYNNVYIQWQRDGKFFILKEHKCYSYKTIELENSTMFNFFKLHEPNIKMEKIFPQGCTLKMEDGDTIISNFIISDHACRTIISLFTATDSLRVYISKNDFDKESNKEYYVHNINLKSYQWSNLIKEQIEELERNKRFIRRTNPCSSGYVKVRSR